MAKKKSVFAALYQQLFKWFIKKGWPWIVKNVWPAIEGRIIDIFNLIVDKLKDALLQWFSERNRNQEETAQRRAEDAERKAKSTQDETEAKTYRATAEVWREVAENFRQENEILREKLDSLTKKSASEFGQDLHSLKVEDIIEESEDSTIKIKGTDTVLSLPSPSDE